MRFGEPHPYPETGSHTDGASRGNKERVIVYTTLTDLFLGAFARLRRAAVSFVMSVRLSVRMEQLGSHWTDFHEIWYLSVFQKSVAKIIFSIKI
jgi:hypothetical protein